MKIRTPFEPSGIGAQTDVFLFSIDPLWAEEKTRKDQFACEIPTDSLIPGFEYLIPGFVYLIPKTVS